MVGVGGGLHARAAEDGRSTGRDRVDVGPFRAGLMAVSGGAGSKDLTVREDGFFIMGGAAAPPYQGYVRPHPGLLPRGEGEWFDGWLAGGLIEVGGGLHAKAAEDGRSTGRDRVDGGLFALE